MGRILDTLGKDYLPASSPRPQRPEDFNILGEVARGKGYLGLIYADANNMGRALEEKKTLKELQDFAEKIDKAVFEAMARAIRAYLPVAHHSEYGDLFPFDVLLIGGDDIAMVTPADKAMQVAHMLADQFYQITAQQFSEETYTLSVGVVLAPAKYPFSLQYELVDETLKAAKKASAKRQAPGTSGNQSQEQSLVNFVVLTGSTSLSYEKQYEEMQGKNSAQKTEHYATLRPYNLADLDILLEQLKKGNELRLGRTKLHQLREAILKLNNTTAIIE